jgi:hypothetical protein
MSRRDFIAAAAIVRQAHYLSEAQRVQLFEDLAEWFKADNPRFSPDRFFAACAIGDGFSGGIQSHGRRAA